MNVKGDALPAPPSRAAGLAVYGSLALSVTLALSLPSDAPLHVTGSIALAVLSAQLLGLHASSSTALCTASGLYWVALTAFHFGAAIPFALGVEPPGRFARETGIYRWIDTDFTSQAVLVSLVGCSAFLVGRHHALARRQPDRSAPDSRPPSALREEQTFGRAGVLLLCLGAGSWLLGVLDLGGVRILTSSYGDYLTSTEAAAFGFQYLAISLGLVFVAASSRAVPSLLGLCLFASFAAVAPPLGLRGEVMFPTAALVWIRARRVAPMRNRTVVLAVGAFLLASATIREVRMVGLRETTSEHLSAGSVLVGSLELGATLRPVAECIRWRAEGDALLLGASYWAPFERMVTRVVPVTSRLPGNQDMRLQNNVVRERSGTIGFSVIAEAYRNFGLAGAGFVLGFIGFLMGTFDTTPPTARALAVCGAIFVPLLIHVRNDFTPTPAHILAGFVCVAICSLLSSVRRSGAPPPRWPTQGEGQG